jgi:signal transduction histidine kinase
VQIGLLEIYYLECMPDKDEGPFLAEERRLINAIAERIGGIIERKRSQAALEESESRNRALLNAIPDLMFQINGEGKLLRFHEGKLTDLRPFLSEWVGKNVYVLADDKRLLPKRIIEQLRMYVRRAFTTGKTQVFEQHVMICGTKSDFEIRIVASSPDEVLGIVRDITLRKRLEREILEISGREQRRIGHDLHDSLCQHLAGVAFMAKVLERNLAAGLAVESSRAGEIVDLIDQAITLTRSLARGLNPVRLEAGGLMTALTELASNTEKFFAIKCRFSSKEPIVIDDNATASHLYRIAQEAISNSIKHGKADSISIIFETDGKTSTLTIKDNGSGSVSSISQGKGMGLNIMNYRASMIGATLDIKNDTDKGIVVICSFPNKKTD